MISWATTSLSKSDSKLCSYPSTSVLVDLHLWVRTKFSTDTSRIRPVIMCAGTSDGAAGLLHARTHACTDAHANMPAYFSPTYVRG
jgi:hypothetical protein